MLDRLVLTIDRYTVTVVYALSGLLNAPSSIHLAGFVAVGLAIDLLAPRFLSSAAADKDNPHYDPERALKNGWRWLYCLAAVYLVLDYGIILVATMLSPASTDLVGPYAFAIASPLSQLLRNHYTVLLNDGYAARANHVAIVYAGQFIVSYAALAMAFCIGRCRFADGAAIRTPKGFDPRKSKPWWYTLVLLAIVAVVIGFAIYVVTYLQINYSDDSLGRRHLNLNLRDHSKFFFDLAMFLSGICLTVPFSYHLLRFMLLDRGWLGTHADPSGKAL